MEKCPEEGCNSPLFAHDCCGAEPPREMTDAEGRVWISGDCWCTLEPHHDAKTKHICGPCAERFGSPGWYDSDHEESALT